MASSLHCRGRTNGTTDRSVPLSFGDRGERRFKSRYVHDRAAAGSGRGFSDSQPVAVSKWYRWRKSGVAIADYLLDAEVHTFAFSVAANRFPCPLFIPLIVLLYTIAFSVFHSQEMVNVVNKIVEEFLPTTAKQGSEDFLAFWLRWAAQTSGRHGVPALSLVMILISCTGIFLPLEVALNQAWGVTKSRNYLLESGRGLWAGHLDGLSGDGKRFVEHLAASASGLCLLPSHQKFRLRGDQLLVVGGDYRRRVGSVFLLDLLAVAEPKDSRAAGRSHFDHHWRGLAGCEGRICGRSAAP